MKRIILVILSVASLFFSFSPLALAAEQSSSRVNLDTYGHPFLGPADAPVTIVVFSDYL